jgi:outer membrane protein insertion porin family
VGLKGAVFADAGTLFGYEGATRFTLAGNPILDGFAPTPCVTNSTQPQTCIAVRDEHLIRSSVGASLLWNSPLGPIRFDYAFALTKDEGFVAANGQRVGGDRTQAFRFSGGTRF